MVSTPISIVSAPTVGVATVGLAHQRQHELRRPAHRGEGTVHEDRPLQQCRRLDQGGQAGHVARRRFRVSEPLHPRCLAPTDPARRLAKPCLQLLELCTAERLLQVLACVEGGAALLEQAKRSAALGARRVVEQHGRGTPEERHFTHGGPASAFGVLRSACRTEAARRRRARERSRGERGEILRT
jgi:hypothetical protein